MSCDCPVLPKKTTPWQPLSIRFSAYLIVFSLFNARFLSNTDNVAAYIPLIIT